MKTNFFSNTLQVLCSRSLFLFATWLLCLSGLIGIGLAQPSKEPTPASKREERETNTIIAPAKVAAKSPWPELRNLMYRGDFAFDQQEALEIDIIYAAARSALQAIRPGPTAGVEQRAVKLKWAGDMEAFLNAHTNSAWAPGIALTLGNVSRVRLGYSKAADM